MYNTANDRYQYKCTYTLNKEIYKKNAAFPKSLLKSQEKINSMPDINENPLSATKPSKFIIRRAEDVQEEHKRHLNSLFQQLRQTHSSSR